MADYIKIKHIRKYTKDLSTNVSLLLLFLICLAGALWLYILVQLGVKPRPVYFPLTESLQIIRPKSLSEPIPKPILLNWINELVRTAFSFNYSNMEDQSRKLAPFLSNEGMRSYMKMLQTDQSMTQVVNKKLIVSVYPKRAPNIVKERNVKGNYRWNIILPVTMVFSNANRSFSQDATIGFIVKRVPESDSPIGITVVRFIVKVTRRRL